MKEIERAAQGIFAETRAAKEGDSFSGVTRNE